MTGARVDSGAKVSEGTHHQQFNPSNTGYGMLTVFTSANRGYHPFIIPYLSSVLSHNKGSAVELVVEDVDHFKTQNSKALALISDAFSEGSFLLRSGDFQKVGSHAIRFMEEPTIQSDYVYIGDIDVLVLSEIPPIHLKQMEKTGLPFSNLLRQDNPQRLTGLHFTRRDAHYPLPSVEIPTGHGWDEVMLTRQVEAKGHSTANAIGAARPMHGPHLSLRRAPLNPVGWDINPAYAEAFKEFATGDLWKSLVPLLDDKYKRLFLLLETAMMGRFVSVMEGYESPLRAYCMWDDWNK